MVTTRPLRSSDRSTLSRLSCAAMSTEPHFAFLRPRHAAYTERSEHFYVRKHRMIEACADVVARVAIADDADSFVDFNLGEDATGGAGGSITGSWNADGEWVPDTMPRVAEGRVLGYSVWQRFWPGESIAARRAKERASRVWSGDTYLKRLDRALYTLMDRFWNSIDPDPSEDAEAIKEFIEEGGKQTRAHIEDVVNRLNHTTGYIFCFAMAVDPAFQRRGIGARMMRWGLDRSQAEGAPIILTSTTKGSGLYERLGFETLGVMSVDDGNVREKTMIYWPPCLSAGPST